MRETSADIKVLRVVMMVLALVLAVVYWPVWVQGVVAVGGIALLAYLCCVAVAGEWYPGQKW